MSEAEDQAGSGVGNRIHSAEPGTGSPPRPRAEPGPGDLLTRIGIPGRLGLLFVAVAIVYALFRAGTHLLFAPTLEVQRLVLPPEPVSSGEAATLGAVVRNTGALPGAAFVVAALEGGLEVEGGTREVAPGDTALVTVEVTANSGHLPATLSVFDGWRGVRLVHTFRSVPLEVLPREVAGDRVRLAGQIRRGTPMSVELPWENPGPMSETVVPVVIFRREGGGPPTAVQGPAFEVVSGARTVLAFTVDTWPLSPGGHGAEVHLVTGEGRRAGHVRDRFSLQILEP
jgi:hypothetical protein